LAVAEIASGEIERTTISAPVILVTELCAVVQHASRNLRGFTLTKRQRR
jgi:hypothetical protein